METNTAIQPEPTGTAEPFYEPPLGIGEQMAKILIRSKDADFFNPWRSRLTRRERLDCFAAVVKEAGLRYSACTLDSFRVQEEATDEKRPSQHEAFDTFRAHVEIMPEWIMKGRGIVLYGRPGTGKDHLLMAAAYEAILIHGWEVKLVSGLNLYQRARDRISDGRSELDFIDEYRMPRILILSDPVPPRGDTTSYNTDVLYRILDRRYRDLKSTWVTLNVVDGEEAERRLAGALLDRMKDGALSLECNWPSYRKPRG